MKIKRIICINVFILSILLASGQNKCDFSKLGDFKKHYKFAPSVIKRYPKDSLYKVGEYASFIKKITSMPDSEKLAKDYYSAAACYDKLGMVDSAMQSLFAFMTQSTDDRAILHFDDFPNLQSDKEKWKKIITKIEESYLNEAKNATNKELALQIFYLAVDRYREGLPYAELVSSAIDSLIKIGELSWFEVPQYRKDLETIIQKYGFPTIQMVGNYAAFQAYDILHHSAVLVKYYPKVKEAFEAGGVDTELFVMMTDRFLRQKGRKQMYGTQMQGGGLKYCKKYPDIYVLSPVKDFKNVNKRRQAMGLNTVEEYIENFVLKAMIPPEYYKGKNRKKKN